jgi:hypothetical protein
MDDRVVSNGFIRLGVSNWEADNAYGGGIPERNLAIAYAQGIGADVVIYATHAAADKYNYSEHLIGSTPGKTPSEPSRPHDPAMPKPA